MRRPLLHIFISLCILQSIASYSQYYFYNDRYYNTDWVVELGVSGGIMNSLTDIGGRKGVGKKFAKDLNWKMSKPSFGLYLMSTYKDVIGIRVCGTFGNVGSYDSILKKVGSSTFGRYERNLSFQSTITDIQLSAEVHPFFFRNYEEDGAPRYSPYVVAGIGLFMFNPQANLNGQWQYLHPLRTEGQGFEEYRGRHPYKLTQLNIPLGIGLKYELSSFFNARLEFLYRILFTDYIDDVSQMDYIDPSLFIIYLSPSQAAIAQQLFDRRISSKNNQRGDPKDNDAFFTIQLKIGICFRSARRSR